MGLNWDCKHVSASVDRGAEEGTAACVGDTAVNTTYRFVPLLLSPLLPCTLPDRPDYMTTFVDKLINWDAVAKRYEAATA